MKNNGKQDKADNPQEHRTENVQLASAWLAETALCTDSSDSEPDPNLHLNTLKSLFIHDGDIFWKYGQNGNYGI